MDKGRSPDCLLLLCDVGQEMNLSVLPFPPLTAYLNCVLIERSEKTFGFVDSHVGEK